MEQIVNDLVAQKLAEAGLDVSKRTIQLRVLREIAENHLKIDMNTIYDLKNQTYISQDVLRTIDTVCNEHLNETLSHQEKNFVQKIRSRDYHRDGDLARLATILNKKANADGRRLLDVLFAVDKFDGIDYKNYVSNLGTPGDIYSAAVRKLYDGGATCEQVHDAIVEAFKEGDIENPLAISFREYIGENRFEAIADAKKKEIEKKKAANKNKKRKQEEEEEEENGSQ